MTDHSPVEESLGVVYTTPWSPEVMSLLFLPAGGQDQRTIGDAMQLIEQSSVYSFPEHLLPLAAVDEGSLAVTALESVVEGHPPGFVYRWFLGDVPAQHQLDLLDINPLAYIASMQEELKARPIGLSLMLDEIGPAYQVAYLAKDKEKRPRDFVVRPIRIACQNVVVGLAAIAQDAAFDGLSVVAWQTCEVPHVATHEANRALAALTLCDTFQNGGTMEVRFDREARVVLDGEAKRYRGHPEGQVPASLRRYGRTVGVVLGGQNPAAISPSEARQLFLAVTPMPPELRARVLDAVEHGGITPERLCFTLLSQIWREVELDFMLATSSRANSILEGGAPWANRSARQAEMEICRAAMMAGMFFRRLNSRDAAGVTEEARVVEDRKAGVTWSVMEEPGAIRFSGLDAEAPLPWVDVPTRTGSPSLVVFPRSVVTEATLDAACCEASAGGRVALVLPLGADSQIPVERLRDGVLVLRCPDRAADLDRAVEKKLLTSRIARE